MRRRRVITAGVMAALVAGPARAADVFALRDTETVVFAGDSITQAGHYVVYVEGYLRTRFPERHIRIVNAGKSGETVAGLSEPTHPGPRPVLFERFDRDVAAHSPTRVVACYGMNDGIYHPFDEARFARYQEGIRRLIERVRDGLKVPLLILTPPVCDLQGRTADTLGSSEGGFSFRKPSPDYDSVLERYSGWLTTLRGDGVEVVDLHAAMKAHLAARRRESAGFRVQRDGVHPDETGHLLIALAVLDAWHAPAEVAEAQIDAAKKALQSPGLTDGAFTKDALSFRWASPLPMPFDEKWDAASVRLERVAERLSRHRLLVRGLKPGRYTLAAAGSDAGTFTAEELAAGVDLTALPALITNVRSADVLQRLRSRGALNAAAAEELDVDVASRCRPVPITVSVRRAE
jgi:lysophospholipase L1-like esterase